MRESGSYLVGLFQEKVKNVKRLTIHHVVQQTLVVARVVGGALAAEPPAEAAAPLRLTAAVLQVKKPVKNYTLLGTYTQC